MTFNLRTLLGLVTLLCVLAWLLTAAPPFVAAIGLFVYVTLQTTFFVAGAMYAGENLKAFCRGALLPGLVDYAFVAWVFIQLALASTSGCLNRAAELQAQNVSKLIAKPPSHSMTGSAKSSKSAPRSLAKEVQGVIWCVSTPNCVARNVTRRSRSREASG
jgi:hypothetical protein